jgi:hypothetical protein
MSYSDEEDDHNDSSFLTEEDEEDDNPEMLTLNLAFGSKNDTIQVHWNDDPEDLAQVSSLAPVLCTCSHSRRSSSRSTD